MRHPSLPETMTAEQLGAWIEENKIGDPFDHTEKTVLSQEEISEHEHKVAMASRAILKLEEVKKEFMEFIKNGTPFDNDNDTYIPVAVTIPPSKGLNALKSNVEFHSAILELGYTEEVTKIYKIPYPEKQLIVAVDIEGNEWKDYTRKMTKEEKDNYNTLFKAGEEPAILDI